LHRVQRLVIALLLLFHASPSQAQAPAHVIPFELYDNRIWLAVSGPGFGPRPFILDTGAQSTHYTAELAAEARLRTAGRVGITGTGTERIRGSYVAPTTLRIGSLALPVGRGIAGPADALFGPVYSGIGRRFDGVIGYDLFAAFVVEIDYSGGQLRLYERGRRGTLPAERIPIRILDRKPYLAASLALGGERIPANLHLDTGFGGAISLNANFTERHGLIDRAGPTLRTTLRGVGGATEARVARLPAIRIGSFELAGPIASLALVQGRGVRSDSSGRIGGELLRRFTVTIDYGGRAMKLVPNAGIAVPFETDMSGLAIAMAADGAIDVASVADGTPAAEAGIRETDRLVALDGVPIERTTLEAVRLALRAEGAVRRLRIARGGREREVSLVLRRRL
jgi:hypothetical protein